MHARCASKGIHLKAGVVGKHEFTGDKTAVELGLFASIGFKRRTVFSHMRKGREVGNRGDFDSLRCCGPGKVAELSGIRGGDENSLHSESQQ